MKCKEYQVNLEIVKCLAENKHSEYCSKEQGFKKKYPNAKEIIWLPEKQNWQIKFMELNETSPKTKKVQEKKEKEVVEISEGDDGN